MGMLQALMAYFSNGKSLLAVINTDSRNGINHVKHSGFALLV